MLYSIGFFIFSVFYLPTLLFKGRLHAEFGERFAIFGKVKERALLSGKDRIWIQAVSVGEVALCKNFIPLLKEKFPANDIIVSTITKAGNDLGKKIFPKDVIVIYFPLDFRFLVRKTINFIKPRLYIMIETEIWPNLLKELSDSSIPSVLINGRISDRSIGKYGMVKPFLKKVLSRIRVFCMQDSIDADRIISLGAPVERVKVTGNMKFDVHAPAGSGGTHSARAEFGLGAGETLLVAGSTHEGEEEQILDVFKKLSDNFPKLRLIIAPRHMDRVSEVENLVQIAGLKPARYSDTGKTLLPGGGKYVLLLDTIGHLNDAYSISDVVFIGGSLVRHGGHNPIEPAIFSKPILFGLHMFNFKYITNVFLRNKAAIQVFNKEDLYEKCRLLLNDINAMNALGRNARKVIDENKGATQKNIEEIAGMLR